MVKCFIIFTFIFFIFQFGIKEEKFSMHFPMLGIHRIKCTGYTAVGKMGWQFNKNR